MDINYFDHHSRNNERLVALTSRSIPLPEDLIPLMRDYEAATHYYQNLLTSGSDLQASHYLYLSRVAIIQLANLVNSGSIFKGFVDVVRLRSFQGGLANRLRALSAGFVIANIYKTRFEISWQPDKHCDIDFESMFPSCFDGKLSILTPSDYIESLADGHGSCLEIVGNPSALVLWDRYCKNLIDWQDFYCKYRAFLESVFGEYLDSTIATRIEDFLAMNSVADCVGVHIRSTDFSRHYQFVHPERILASVGDFINKLAELRASKVFLSTDSVACRDDFLNNFPGLVVNIPHNFHPASFRQTAIDSAVCDIYVLSKCSSLVATLGSSFSSMAADLGNRRICYI